MADDGEILVDANPINMLTVSAIRQELKKRGLSSKGKRSQLESRLREELSFERRQKESVHEELPVNELDDVDTHSIGEGSDFTSISGVSSVARLRAKQEKAELEARMKALKRKQAIEMAKLKLSMEAEELELETEIDVARAKEKVLNEFVADKEARVNESVIEIDADYSQEPGTTQPREWPVVKDQGATNKLITMEPESIQQREPPVVETKEETTTTFDLMRQGQRQQQELLDTMRLPQVKLMSYDGNPLQYWVFIKAFETNVDQTSLDDKGKLIRLIQYCTGKARAVIECCAIMEPTKGYAKAKALLKDRFGDSYTIAETWVSKITCLQPIGPYDNVGLRAFADDLRNCKETLEAMGHVEEISTQRVMVTIVERLPNYLRNRWVTLARKIKKRHSKPPSIDDLVEFVNDSSEEVNDPVYGRLNKGTSDLSRNKSKFDISKSKSGKSTFSITTEHTPNNNPQCLMCNENHTLFSCNRFIGKRVQDRVQFAKDKKLCFNCLTPGHMSRRCTLNRTCPISNCGRKHSKFLHMPDAPKPQLPTIQSGLYTADCNVAGAKLIRVALPIVPVRVRAAGGCQYVNTYALLDSGSTNTFCSQKLAKHVNAVGMSQKLSLTTLDKSNSYINTTLVSLEVASLDENQIVDLPVVYATPDLCISDTNLARPSDVARWPHLNGITFPQINTTGIDILIGQDVPEALIPLEVRNGKRGEPYATRTQLGWVLNGPTRRGGIEAATSMVTLSNNSIESYLKRLWQLDTISSVDDEIEGLSINDRKVLSVWNESIHVENGHYAVNIPFKTRPPGLPNNLTVAQRRLQLLGRRLTKDESLRKRYTAEIHKLLKEGYAEPVSIGDIDRVDGLIWYLPHHPVFNPKKPDKCRIVFDCAAKLNGVSLNDRVHQGPDLTNKLVGVLLKFRQEQVAFMADIESMFHQVKVTLNDRDVLRFLWWADDEPGGLNVNVYRMTAHLFGGVWSPSCANFALQRTVRDNANEFKANVLSTVTNNFYVDDCLKSTATVEEAVNLVHKLRELLLRGGFKLTKWISNRREIMLSLPEEELAKGLKCLNLNLDDLPCERALGILWNVENDQFQFDIRCETKPNTRRGMLSVIGSVYDPLGYGGPFVLRARILFQRLCRLSYGWDDLMPQDIELQWGRWLEDLPTMRSLTIPRCFKPAHFDVASAQLHHFADASELGYGAVAYIRLTDTNGNVHCTNLMSKSRLAPLKTATIPRLELAAAVESVKLDKILRRELEVPMMESVFWSDSMIVLWYIQNEEARFKTYVANRVAIIRGHSSPRQWRHVGTNDNPADDASRGLSASELISSYRWINGPEFLWKDPTSWNTQPDFACSELEEIAEVKPNVKAYAVLEPAVESIEQLFKSYSSWYRLKKAVAWILRLKHVLKTKRNPKHGLTVMELKEAEVAIVRFIQIRYIDPKLKELKSLNPIKSDDGLMYVGGRLDRANLPYLSRHQMLLPADYHVTRLIIKYFHELTGHAGVERTLAETRRGYWIVKGRRTVRNLLSRCVICKRMRGRPEFQIMSELPKSRVMSNEAPFTRVGVDYFGPIMIKRGRSELKRYGCLFSCFATRAIHLEVSHSLSTDSFISALQRFIARRGVPEEICSDNGTNFVGAQRELRRSIEEWNQCKIKEFLLQRETTWMFNPPAASHMGGVWERQIRSVRSIMFGLLGQQTLDEEGLVTIMCLVENIVNSRPITKLSNDPNDDAPLTPNHLLLLRCGPTLPPGSFDVQDRYRRRWRQVQYLADIFWRRWLNEYLPTLQRRQKWLTLKRNLQVGDLVLLIDWGTPRLRWPLGLITKTYPGIDGQVRSVQVKTKEGVYDRPIVKMCLLEGVI